MSDVITSASICSLSSVLKTLFTVPAGRELSRGRKKDEGCAMFGACCALLDASFMVDQEVSSLYSAGVLILTTETAVGFVLDQGFE